MTVGDIASIRSKIFTEVSLWVAEQFPPPSIFKAEDFEKVQSKGQEICWKHVKALGITDTLNERSCYVYLLGDLLMTIAEVFIRTYADPLAIEKRVGQNANKSQPKSSASTTEIFSSPTSTKKQVLN